MLNTYLIVYLVFIIKKYNLPTDCASNKFKKKMQIYNSPTIAFCVIWIASLCIQLSDSGISIS